VTLLPLAERNSAALRVARGGFRKKRRNGLRKLLRNWRAELACGVKRPALAARRRAGRVLGVAIDPFSCGADGNGPSARDSRFGALFSRLDEFPCGLRRAEGRAPWRVRKSPRFLACNQISPA
jgi:hypothetical protein